MGLQEKAALLDGILRELGSVLVAYSGGADSAFLAWAAHRALGERALAVIADSPSLPRSELAAALAFAHGQGFAVRTIGTAELLNPEYARNDASRCFHCKDELFTRMRAAQAELGFRRLAYGMNLDDGGEFRPGQRAAGLHGARAPLAEAGLGKAEVRMLAREAGLQLWDKPASACLASRIEYGRAVTEENLSQVEQAEAALHSLGFPQVRVRHHGELARVEIARGDLPRALAPEMFPRIGQVVRAAGFRWAAVDTEGYRTGSMNAVLRPEEIAAAR